MSLQSYLEQGGIKHFTAHEINPVGKKANGNGPALLLAPMLLWPHAIKTLTVLEWLRAQVGPLDILSGYRDPAYNEAVGGEKKSLHMLFSAFDITGANASPKEIRAWLLKHPDAKHMGIGLYGPSTGNFLHVDTRGRIGLKAPARWNK